ncbi:MAG: hypothetical protein HFG59_08110 [Lachnospiraceae bacterium]|nr:hypothetical protein [Lachnospiraceae bacterium]
MGKDVWGQDLPGAEVAGDKDYVIRTSNRNEKAELLKLECENCGGSLELVDKTHARCPYCGQRYLIDEAKGTIVHVQVDYSGNKEMYQAVNNTRNALILFLAVGALVTLIVLGFNIAAKKSVFSTSDEDMPVDAHGELLVIFCKDIFGKEYKEITPEEFASIRYLRCSYEREGSEDFNVISYSFTNYEDCGSEEEFQDTVKTWTYRTKRVTWPSDYTMFTGLTRIDTTNTVWLSLLKFSPDSRISRVDTDDRLDTVFGTLNPEYIKVLNLGIMGNNLEGIGRFKNLEELVVDTNLSSQSADISGIEECKKLRKVWLRCGEAYTGLEKLSGLSGLQSIYLDHVRLSDCSFLKDITGLEELSIYTGEEADLSLLDSFPNLKKVDFLDQEYILPGEIPRLTGVEKLRISVGEQECLERLASVESLEELDLHLAVKEYGVPTDISPLARLTGLKRLHLDNFWGDEMVGVEPVLMIPGLEEVWLGKETAGDLEPLLDPGLLEGNPAIQEMALLNCHPKDAATGEAIDFSFLSNYPGIKRLYLDGCDLADISFVEGMEDLRVCSLMDNELLDLSPLLACRKLEAVSFDEKSAASARFPADVEVNTESYIRIYK